MNDPRVGRDRVLAALRRIGGGVTIPELAYKTGLGDVEVVDALCELEADGLAVPWAWTATKEAA